MNRPTKHPSGRQRPFSVRLSPRHRELLAQLSSRLGCSQAEVVARALELLAASVAVLAALCLTGCADVAGPPYDLYLCDSMDTWDREQWTLAADDWNGALGRDAFVVHDEARGKRNGVEICAADDLGRSGNDVVIGLTDTERGEPVMVRYLLWAAKGCSRHELGHVLGLEHSKGGLMDPRSWDEPILHDDVAGVRYLWGW